MKIRQWGTAFAKTVVMVATACLDALVVIIAMTTVGLIVAVLTYAISVSPERSKPIIDRPLKTICISIGVVGVSAIILQVRRILVRTKGRKCIVQLLSEGRRFTGDMSVPISPALDREIRGWCDRVERALVRYLDESYVQRFRVQGAKVLVPDMSLTRIRRESGQNLSLWTLRSACSMTFRSGINDGSLNVGTLLGWTNSPGSMSSWRRSVPRVTAW